MRRALNQLRWASVALAVLFILPDARALDPDRMMSQYVREQWTNEKGLRGGQVRAITQTSDGYLWISTAEGLIRFDGFNFSSVSFGSTTQFSNSAIVGLTTDSDGNLLVRLQGAVVLRQRNGTFENITSAPGPTTSYVTALWKEANGGVLFSDLLSGLLRFRTRQVEVLIPPKDMIGPPIAMVETASGKIWMGTLESGFFSVTPGRVTSHIEGIPGRKTNCLLPVGENQLWIGTDKGLFRWNGTTLSPAGLPPALDHLQILTMLQDRDSNIWVGTAQGLLRINSEGISFSDESEVGGGGAVYALFEDREGNLWAGGARGLERIRDSAFVTYSLAAGGAPKHNGPIYVDPANRTWFAPEEGGIYLLRNGQAEVPKADFLQKEVIYSITGSKDDVWVGTQHDGITHFKYVDGVAGAQTYTHADGLAENSVYAVYLARDGAVWAGTLTGGVSEFKDGRFTTYTSASGLASNTVSSILQTADGVFWFATPNGLSTLSGGRWATYATRDGLPSDNVICLFEDSSGILWIGTSAGLAFVKSGQLHVLSQVPDSLREPIYGLAKDKNGWLWIATANHILRVPSDKLAGGSLAAGDIRQYGADDGLRSTEEVKRTSSVVSDSEGRIWFSTTHALSVVDPSHIADNSASAIAHIEAISADNDPVTLPDLAGSVRVPPSPRRITFNYAGLSLTFPERVRFRYFLDGFDRTWTGPVAARDAVYTNLGPGSYRFRVIASNSDGLWNGAETSVSLQIEPALWQTLWFRLLVLLTAGIAILAFYRSRLHRIARQYDIRLEARVTERTRIARELHDTLLQSFHGLLLRFQTAYALLPERPAEAKQTLESALDQAAQAITEGRDAVQDLRSSPLETNDLAVAIQAIGEELSTDGTSQNAPLFQVEVEGTPRNLHPILRDEVYRIAAEALRNAFRHARARRIEVELRYDEIQFRLRVRDDGKGIDSKTLGGDGHAGHYGLPGMRERAKLVGGTLTLWSERDSGTEIELSIPASMAYAASPRRPWLGEKLSEKFSRKTKRNL